VKSVRGGRLLMVFAAIWQGVSKARGTEIYPRSYVEPLPSPVRWRSKKTVTPGTREPVRLSWESSMQVARNPGEQRGWGGGH